MKYVSLLLLSILVASCQPSNEQNTEEEKEVQVALTTSKGSIVLELSNKTPLHRDNFIKIVEEERLDSMLFHRVLAGFVVQAGEYDSLKAAKMDSTELAATDYRVPAEIDTTLFHKRGALGAARTGNPERASASLSFYVVHRGPRPDSLIDKDEKRINGWLQQHYFINATENASLKDSLINAEDAEDWEIVGALNDTIRAMAKSFAIDSFRISEKQREIYRTLGGTPHLDQNYTVFGEVIQGMDVVDSIAVVDTNDAGRPFEPVYILSAKVVSKE